MNMDYEKLVQNLKKRGYHAYFAKTAALPKHL